MIAPATFIPLAEEIGFIIPLGEWALQAGVRRGRKLARSHQDRRQSFAGRSSAARVWCRR